MKYSERKLNSSLEMRIPFQNITFNLLSINYEPPRYPWYTKNHCHSSYELHFIPSGYGTLRVGTDKYNITPGTFYLTGPGVYHEQNACQANPMTEYCMNFDFTTSKKRHTADSLCYSAEEDAILSAFSENLFWFGGDSFHGSTLCRQMIDEIEKQSVGCYNITQCLALEIILYTARTISNNIKASYALPQKDLNTNRRLLMDEFFRNYSDLHKADELAGILGVSVRHLSRIMMQYYGLTFKQKLIRTRIDQSKILLANSNKPLTIISEAVGYHSVPCFCNLFYKYEHCTPTNFRKQINQENQ